MDLGISAPREFLNKPRSRADRGQTQSRTHRGQTHPQDANLSRGRRRTTPPKKPISGRRPSLPTLASSQHCYSPSPLNAPTPLGHHLCINHSPSLLPLSLVQSHRHPPRSPAQVRGPCIKSSPGYTHVCLSCRRGDLCLSLLQARHSSRALSTVCIYFRQWHL